MSKILWYGDLHMHTNISYCAPRDTVPSSFLPVLEPEDIRVCGFSNHLYYNDWIRPEDRTGGKFYDVDRALSIKPLLEDMKGKTSAKILFGCEVETVFGREPSLDPECAHFFDYILLAPSHIANIIHGYRNVDLSTAGKYRDMILDRFIFACNLDYGVPTGICHPLYPICSPFEQEVVDGIPDSVLLDCFRLAKSKNKSIEIHSCLFRNGTRLNDEGISPSYLRVLAAAKDAGCMFHFGGDAHGPGAFSGGLHARLRKAASIVGIGPDDMWDLDCALK